MPKNKRMYTYITYYYPPWGGVAAQWSIKLIKFLDRNNWTSQVITVKDTSIKFVDTKAEKDVPKGIEVIRAPNFDIFAKIFKSKVKGSEASARKVPHWKKALLKSIRWFYENFYLFEGQFIWIISAVVLGFRSVRNSEVILATIRPGAAGVIGLLLKKLTGKPLVIDYRDPWTQNMTLPTGGIRKCVEEWWERRILNGGDVVVAVSEPVLEGLRSKYPGTTFKGEVVPLGFDPDDFQNFKDADSEAINITYTGSLFASRSPEVFLRGLRMALDKYPRLASKLSVHFYGDFGGPAHEKLVTDFDLGKVVKIHGFVDHQASLEALRLATWLLLIIETIPSEDKGDRFKGVYTGKLFEYLASRRPILALTPESAAAKLINTSKAGITVPNDDPVQVSEELINILNGKYSNLILDRNERLINKFSMDQHAASFGRIFDSTTE